MNVGEMLVEDGDLERIAKIHASSGYDYRLPDFRHNPRYPVQRSVYHRGAFMAAGIIKLDAECYLFVDHECSTPRERLEGLRLLQDDLIAQSRRLGFDQLYCCLPPEVEKSFGRRLSEHGWRKDRGWPRYVYQL